MAVFVFLSSCSTPTADQGVKRRRIDDYYVSSGSVKYFLPDLPIWANSSRSGACFKKTTTRFFQLDSLQSSFAMSYYQAIQFQILFNAIMQEKKGQSSQNFLDLRDEEKVFFETLEKTQAKFYRFDRPDYKRVHVIWIDSYFKEAKGIKKLRKFMSSAIMEKGHPVFVSLCHSYKELENLVKVNGFENDNIRILSNEAFSPFDNQKKLTPGVKVFFNNIFKKKQEIHFFAPSKNIPKEFQGKFKRHQL